MTPTTIRRLALLGGAALLMAAAACAPDEESAENVYTGQISNTTCKQLTSCDALKPCKDSKLACIQLNSCGKAACVDPSIACAMECGAGATCSMWQSYPGQIACEPKPTTPSCSKLASCGVHNGVDTPCKDSKLGCIYLDSCGKAACVDPSVACTMECGAGASCSMMKSYPGQIACDGPGGSTSTSTSTASNGKANP